MIWWQTSSNRFSSLVLAKLLPQPLSSPVSCSKTLEETVVSFSSRRYLCVSVSFPRVQIEHRRKKGEKQRRKKWWHGLVNSSHDFRAADCPSTRKLRRGSNVEPIFSSLYFYYTSLSPLHSQKNRGEISNMGQNLNSTNTQRVIAECAVRSLSRFSLSLKLIYNNMRLYTRFADRKPINRLFSR